MLNIKNAFLLLVFLMLGDARLNSRDADESLTDVFLHLFACNYSLPPNVKVIQTPLMKALFERVGNRCQHILIIGPPSSGKSTTALWLYQQLKYKNMKVKAIPFSGANTLKI